MKQQINHRLLSHQPADAKVKVRLHCRPILLSTTYRDQTVQFLKKVFPSLDQMFSKYLTEVKRGRWGTSSQGYTEMN